MDVVIIIFSIGFVLSMIYLILFHIKEGRDERGQFILTRTYSLAYSVIVAGVVLLLLVDWSDPVIMNGLTIKDALVLILFLSGITTFASLKVLKRKY